MSHNLLLSFIMNDEREWNRMKRAHHVASCLSKSVANNWNRTWRLCTLTEHEMEPQTQQHWGFTKNKRNAALTSATRTLREFNKRAREGERDRAKERAQINKRKVTHFICFTLLPASVWLRLQQVVMMRLWRQRLSDSNKAAKRKPQVGGIRQKKELAAKQTTTVKRSALTVELTVCHSRYVKTKVESWQLICDLSSLSLFDMASIFWLFDVQNIILIPLWSSQRWIAASAKNNIMTIRHINDAAHATRLQTLRVVSGQPLWRE